MDFGGVMFVCPNQLFLFKCLMFVCANLPLILQVFSICMCPPTMAISSRDVQMDVTWPMVIRCITSCCDAQQKLLW